MKHPTQPLERDEQGRLRFKENAIVRKLVDVAREHGCGLGEIATMGFTTEDYVQVMQLIGYSLDGYGELSFVSSDEYATAARMAETGESELQARVAHLQAELDALRDSLRGPIARLYGVHPDNLGEPSAQSDASAE